MYDTETLTTNRRTVLAALFALAVPKSSPIPQSVVQSSLIPGAPAPKFWFGDRVCSLWPSDDSGIQQSMKGNVVGVRWHPLKKHWEYSVIWTDSTIEDYSPTYPIFDEELTEEDLLHRAYPEGELFKQN